MEEMAIPYCPVCAATFTINCLDSSHIMRCAQCSKSSSPQAQGACPWCNGSTAAIRALWDHDQIMAWFAAHTNDSTTPASSSTPGHSIATQKVLAWRAIKQARASEQAIRYALRLNQEFAHINNESYTNIRRLSQADNSWLSVVQTALRILFPTMGRGEKEVEDVMMVIKTHRLDPKVNQRAAIEALGVLQQRSERFEAAEGLMLLSQKGR